MFSRVDVHVHIAGLNLNTAYMQTNQAPSHRLVHEAHLKVSLWLLKCKGWTNPNLHLANVRQPNYDPTNTIDDPHSLFLTTTEWPPLHVVLSKLSKCARLKQVQAIPPIHYLTLNHYFIINHTTSRLCISELGSSQNTNHPCPSRGMCSAYESHNP